MRLITLINFFYRVATSNNFEYNELNHEEIAIDKHEIPKIKEVKSHTLNIDNILDKIGKLFKFKVGKRIEVISELINKDNEINSENPVFSLQNSKKITVQYVNKTKKKVFEYFKFRIMYEFRGDIYFIKNYLKSFKPRYQNNYKFYKKLNNLNVKLLEKLDTEINDHILNDIRCFPLFILQSLFEINSKHFKIITIEQYLLLIQITKKILLFLKDKVLTNSKLKNIIENFDFKKITISDEKLPLIKDEFQNKLLSSIKINFTESQFLTCDLKNVINWEFDNIINDLFVTPDLISFDDENVMTNDTELALFLNNIKSDLIENHSKEFLIEKTAFYSKKLLEYFFVNIYYDYKKSNKSSNNKYKNFDQILDISYEKFFASIFNGIQNYIDILEKIIKTYENFDLKKNYLNEHDAQKLSKIFAMHTLNSIRNFDDTALLEKTHKNLAKILDLDQKTKFMAKKFYRSIINYDDFYIFTIKNIFDKITKGHKSDKNSSKEIFCDTFSMIFYDQIRYYTKNYLTCDSNLINNFLPYIDEIIKKLCMLYVEGALSSIMINYYILKYLQPKQKILVRKKENQ